MTNNEVCKAHSGLTARISNLEGDVDILSRKWDGIQKLIVSTLASAVLSLIGVILLLIKIIK